MRERPEQRVEEGAWSVVVVFISFGLPCCQCWQFVQNNNTRPPKEFPGHSLLRLFIPQIPGVEDGDS